MTKEKIKSIIIDTVMTEEPENSEELKQIMLQKYNIDFKSTNLLLIELEKECKLNFRKKTERHSQTSIRQHIFQKVVWYYEIVGLSIATTISVFMIPDAAYPLTYVRIGLSTIFMLFLPGYSFIRVIFPTSFSTKTGLKNLDLVEPIALSVGLSLALVPLVCFILNYTPWGIKLIPITFSLLSLTLVFATIALLREYQTKLKHQIRVEF
jgi:hypothetical protein